MVKFQSTHLHEVWRWVYMKIIRLRMFQSTHLHEVWPNAVFSMASAYLFQSTHLHEVWLWKWATSNYQWCFNPHTYMRCDQLTIYTNQHLTVSIHTPTWGVTQTKWQLTKLLYVSIHTPTWGVTLNNGHIHYQCEVSIHTPTWGVTIISSKYR